MPEPGDLDPVLRSALSSYGDPGADSGLEQRILARLASAKAATTPRRRWLPWAVALPVAAGVLLLLILSGHQPNRQPYGNAELNSPVRQPLVADTGAVPPADHHPVTGHRTKAATPQANPRPAAVAAKAAPLPKLDVFPTPQPLTPEEQAFAVFLARAPESVRQSFFEAQAKADAPLSIAAIHIEPLDPPDKN